MQGRGEWEEVNRVWRMLKGEVEAGSAERRESTPCACSSFSDFALSSLSS